MDSTEKEVEGACNGCSRSDLSAHAGSGLGMRVIVSYDYEHVRVHILGQYLRFGFLLLDLVVSECLNTNSAS